MQENFKGGYSVPDQTTTPLLTAMQVYVQDNVTPFHTPGHKMGKGIHPKLGEILGSGSGFGTDA